MEDHNRAGWLRVELQFCHLCGMRHLILVLSCLIMGSINAQQWNWAVDAGGGGNTDFCHGIATDSQGNAYWAGSVSGTAEFGCGTLTVGNTIAGFIAKVDSNGVCQWVRGITVGFNNAHVYGIAIDADDRIYVTGSYDGNATFGSGITLNSLGSDDIFLARYNVDGHCLWARRAGSSASDDEARGIALSPDGGVFIAGVSGGTTIGFDGISVPNPGNYRQIVVARYDSAGTVQWAKASTGNGQYKSARGIAVANGRLYVTGQFSFIAGSFDGIPISTTNAGGKAYLLACDLDGHALWANSYGSGDHEGMATAADTLGNIFMVGRMWGSLLLPDDTLVSVSSNDDIMLLKFDADGNYQWGRSTGSYNRDLAWGVTADGKGNAYVAAQFHNTVDLFGTSLSSTGGEDIAILKLDGSGSVVWAAKAGGVARDVPLCIHRQATAPYKLYFGGYYWGTVTYGNSTITHTNNGDAMMISATDSTFDVSLYAAAVCPGSCNGEAIAFANGLEPFTYQWSNGANTSSITGLCQGEYIVEVTDASGSVEVDTVFVTEHELAAFSIQQDEDSLWVDATGSGWLWQRDGITVSTGQPYHIAMASGTYMVQLLDEHGCTSVSNTIIVVLNVGLGEQSSNTLRVWPNPVADVLFLEVNATAVLPTELLNSAGQRVRSITLRQGRNTVDMGGLAPGLYLLRTVDGDWVRLVKE